MLRRASITFCIPIIGFSLGITSFFPLQIYNQKDIGIQTILITSYDAIKKLAIRLWRTVRISHTFVFWSVSNVQSVSVFQKLTASGHVNDIIECHPDTK
jgi:hypothetical protein